MPRQSAATVEFTLRRGSTRALLQAPAVLTEAEKKEFVALIVGTRSNHFVPSDLPLLAALSKAIVAERLAAAELSAAYIVDGTGDLAGRSSGADDGEPDAGLFDRRQAPEDVHQA